MNKDATMRPGWMLAAAGTVILAAGCVDVRVGPDAAGDRSSEQQAVSDNAASFGTGGGLKETAEQIARIATGITLGATHGAVFHAYDTLALPGEPIDLTVRLRRAETLQSVAGATIAYTLESAPADPNAPPSVPDRPRPLGKAVTNAQGYASIRYTPAVAGDTVVTASIQAVADTAGESMLEVSAARLLVAARPKEAELIVVDLDHTLVASGFHTVLLGSARPMADSQRVLGEIARGHTVVYLTHRPDLLAVRSKRWLSDHRYPPGPVLMGNVSGLLAGSGPFKSARLSDLRRVYPNIRLGIGDKVSDARSYADNGIAAYLIPHLPDKPKTLRQLAREIRRLPETVQVVHNWRELRDGVMAGRRYPPKRLAQWLIRRARRLEASQDEEDDDRDEQDDD